MAPSKELNDVIGALGGGLLAAMMLPQLYKMYKTRRAHDISLGFLALYGTGTLLLFIYLYYEGATVAWICLAIEMGLLVVVATGKLYLDYWGPYGTLTNRGKSTQELLHQSSTVSEPGEAFSRAANGDAHQLANDAEQGAGSVRQSEGAAAGQVTGETVRQRAPHV